MLPDSRRGSTIGRPDRRRAMGRWIDARGAPRCMVSRADRGAGARAHSRGGRGPLRRAAGARRERWSRDPGHSGAARVTQAGRHCGPHRDDGAVVHREGRARAPGTPRGAGVGRQSVPRCDPAPRSRPDRVAAPGSCGVATRRWHARLVVADCSVRGGPQRRCGACGSPR